MALIAVADVAAGPAVGLLPLVALGPAFAGLTGGLRRTALIGVLALVLCLGLGSYNDLFPGRRGYTALLSVAGVTAAGLTAVVLRRRHERELAGVRSIAEVAQRVLLRPVPRTAGPVRIAVSYTSAVAEARIGGDLYEVTAVPGAVRLIVGDVQGKGLEAVETAADVVGAFREAAQDEEELTGVGARLARSVDRSLNGERFVTALLVEVRDDGTATLLNFGHPAPLRLRLNGTADFLEPPEHAPPLGLGLQGADLPCPYDADFALGDQLLIYTDGVSEARGPDGAFYPLRERAHLLGHGDPDDALAALRADLGTYTDSKAPHDDAAMMLLRRRTAR
ncbi:PP2C family protein-serine/threonine phosphatase (plasmid) [Streptomyces sp. CA-294286]|uniref:PP2C family protein-serine/threonine phosphatase n=1 Tax=Streptomyces sp. CA-294286 TaxID=3240070 RepID=UPI003D8B0607